MAEVNGHRFVNNSSIGLYPETVQLRERYQERIGGSKWENLVFAFLNIFRRFPLYDVKLHTDEATLHQTTPFLFVGNNHYGFDLMNLGQRQTLAGGKLSLYSVNCTSRLELLRLTFLSLLGRLKQDEDFYAHLTEEAWIESRRKRIRVSRDGEVLSLKPPLHYRILPRGLKIIGE